MTTKGCGCSSASYPNSSRRTVRLQRSYRPGWMSSRCVQVGNASATVRMLTQAFAHRPYRKGQALHNSTGYALRRFNLDISKEKFESNLEKLNASLVVENQTLAHENKQLNLLLREYEQTLETIMGRFRSFSVSLRSLVKCLSPCLIVVGLIRRLSPASGCAACYAVAYSSTDFPLRVFIGASRRRSVWSRAFRNDCGICPPQRDGIAGAAGYALS